MAETVASSPPPDNGAVDPWLGLWRSLGAVALHFAGRSCEREAETLESVHLVKRLGELWQVGSDKPINCEKRGLRGLVILEEELKLHFLKCKDADGKNKKKGDEAAVDKSEEDDGTGRIHAKFELEVGFQSFTAPGDSLAQPFYDVKGLKLNFHIRKDADGKNKMKGDDAAGEKEKKGDDAAAKKEKKDDDHALWIRDSSLISSESEEVPWYLDDGTGCIHVVGARKASRFGLEVGFRSFIEPGRSLAQPFHDVKGVKILGVERIARMLRVGSSLTVVGEVVKDNAGTFSVRRPHKGPLFYVSPRTIDELIDDCIKEARSCRYASVGLTVVGAFISVLYVSHYLEVICRC